MQRSSTLARSLLEIVNGKVPRLLLMKVLNARLGVCLVPLKTRPDKNLDKFGLLVCSLGLANLVCGSSILISRHSSRGEFMSANAAIIPRQPLLSQDKR